MNREKTQEPAYTRHGQALAELVGENVRLHNRLLAASERMARDLGISGARWQVLSVIGRSPEPATISDVARWMGLARQSVQRVADALAAGRLVEYLPNPNHRRAQLVQLTVKGQKLLRQLDRRRYRWANEVAADLDPAAIEAAVGLLIAVRKHLGS